MKRIAIISLSVLFLTACSTTNYDNEVSTQTYQEKYKIDDINQPISDSSAQAFEEDVKVTAARKASNGTTKNDSVRVFYDDDKQISQPNVNHFLVQVISVQNGQNLTSIASGLPVNQSKWENEKTVKGKQWHSLLFGDFATEEEARNAIIRLPASFQAMNPFVKSVQSIKNSNSPILKKLP